MDLGFFFEKLFSGFSLAFSGKFWGAFPERLGEWLAAIEPYSTVLSLLFLTGIVYCFFRIEQIVEETAHHDEGEAHGAAASAAAVPPSASRARFERVLTRLHSEQESDWRLAVLEADVLLDEMVTQMGYRGDSLGEKLKAVEASDFTTLAKAWEAHAIRNKIAHEGAAFALPEREAKRVVGLYEEVFKEFHFI